MALHRTILAIVLSLATAFVPVASSATARSCGMTTEMAIGQSGDCPCHDAMPDCDAMTPCQTASGCANHCKTSCGVVSAVFGQVSLQRTVLSLSAAQRLPSLSIKPPSPPPRF